MRRTITQHEMDRRLAMAKAKSSITKAMEDHNLTALEWVNVLVESQEWVIAWGLKEEWKESTGPAD